MSPQIIEIVILAGIALVILNRLFSALGTTDEDDPMKKKSIFGEYDNNNKEQGNPVREQAESKFNYEDVGHILKVGDKEAFNEALRKVFNLKVDFSPIKFMKGANAARKIIIEATRQNNEKGLKLLVDPRFYSSMHNSNSKILSSSEDISLQSYLTDLSVFGNNIIARVQFENIEKGINEEWSFQKNSLISSSNWLLTNIDI